MPCPHGTRSLDECHFRDSLAPFAKKCWKTRDQIILRCPSATIIWSLLKYPVIAQSLGGVNIEEWVMMILGVNKSNTFLHTSIVNFCCRE